LFFHLPDELSNLSFFSPNALSNNLIGFLIGISSSATLLRYFSGIGLP
jgi:hypothetical protein